MAFTDPNNLIDPELLLDYVTAQFGESNKFITSSPFKLLTFNLCVFLELFMLISKYKPSLYISVLQSKKLQ